MVISLPIIDAPPSYKLLKSWIILNYQDWHAYRLFLIDAAEK